MKVAWARWMRLGLGQLRLSPDVFWSLTPAELMLIAGLESSQTPMNRGALGDLSALYPDERE